MPDTVIRFDADTTNVQIKLSKVGDSIKKSTADAGKEYQNMLLGIGTKLLSVAAAIQMINAVVERGTQMGKNLAEKAGEAGNRDLSAAQFAKRTGVDNQFMQSYMNSSSSSGATPDEKMKFMSGLSQFAENYRRTHAGNRMDPRVVENYMRQFSQAGPAVAGSGGEDLLAEINANPAAPYSADYVGGRFFTSRNGKQYRGGNAYGPIMEGRAGISEDASAEISVRLAEAEQNQKMIDAARSDNQSLFSERKKQAIVDRWNKSDYVAGFIPDSMLRDYAQAQLVIDRFFGRNSASDKVLVAVPTIPNLNSRNEVQTQ